MKLFLSPHNDDETLFGAFTLLREKPVVVVVLDSYLQEQRGHGITFWDRRGETMQALEQLGARYNFLGFRDDRPEWLAIERQLCAYDPEHVWAPAVEPTGHEHHNRVGEIADRIWPGRVTHYMTYTPAGKSRGVPVPFEPEWVEKKLRALACYRSQLALRSTWDHFLREQYEYYAG